MKCARCSAEIPRQSQFCLRCGNPVSAAYNPAPGATSMPASVPPPTANRNLMIVIAVLVLALVGVLGAVVGGKLLQKPGQTDTGQLVQAPGAAGQGTLVQAPAASNPAPIVQAPGDTQPPTIVQSPSQPTVNTTDIDDYLKFVRQIETLKQKLIHDELGNALEMMTQAKGLSASIDEDQYNSTFQGLGKDTNKIADDWNQLTAKFRDRQPPEACADLRNKYLDQLAKIQAQIVEVNTALNKVQSDPSAALHTLTTMSGTASAEADAAAQSADDALADVCKKYNLSKDFSVRTDSGSASLLR
jgi:hypothetical protein